MEAWTKLRLLGSYAATVTVGAAFAVTGVLADHRRVLAVLTRLHVR